MHKLKRKANSSTINDPPFHEYPFPCSAQPTDKWRCTLMPPICLYGMNTHKTLPLPLNINSKFAVTL